MEKVDKKIKNKNFIIKLMEIGKIMAEKSRALDYNNENSSAALCREHFRFQERFKITGKRQAIS